MASFALRRVLLLPALAEKRGASPRHFRTTVTRRALPTRTKTFVLQNPPLADIDVGTSLSATFALSEEPVRELKEGEALVRTVFLSNDPAQRRWIQADLSDDNHYVDPVVVGEVMRSAGIGKVIKTSGDSKVQEGDYVSCVPGWREYAVLPSRSLRLLKNVEGVPPSAYLGTLGIPGLTAYYGVTEILKLRKGESIVVSGAAGAVGNVVVQYSKKVIGASKVIAIAGSKEKGEWLKTLGADIALDYKDANFAQDLAEATKGHIDCYFDNVGGEILDLMLPRMQAHGRIAACGAVSIYNNPKATNLKNWFDVIAARVTIKGFLLRDYLKRAKEGTKALEEAIKDGKLDMKGVEEVHEVAFEEVPRIWGKLFKGETSGKLITKISNP